MVTPGLGCHQEHPHNCSGNETISSQCIPSVNAPLSLRRVICYRVWRFLREPWRMHITCQGGINCVRTTMAEQVWRGYHSGCSVQTVGCYWPAIAGGFKNRFLAGPCENLRLNKICCVCLATSTAYHNGVDL